MEIRKRSIAAVIDVFIIRFITIAAYCMAVSISDMLHNRVIRLTTKGHIGKVVYLILLYIIVMLCIHFLYFWVSEIKGGSIGKKLAKYEPGYGKSEVWKAVRISLFKTGACVLYVVTVAYFLFTGRMPYDKARETKSE